MVIYHIVLPDAWAAFDGDIYEAESLATEGFIHCSFEHQLAGVLQRYYSGAESVIILVLDTEKLTSNVVEEESTGGEVYPHIYGPINRDAIDRTFERKIETADLK